MDRRALKQIANCYRTRAQRGYAYGKLSGDPVYGMTASLFAEQALPVLDIGCGMGLLGHFLHACGYHQRYLGLDHDERKIAAGNHAIQRAGLDAVMSLQLGDAADIPPVLGHVALLDVLHYLPAERQHALLLAAARQLAPNGSLVIRSVLKAPHWRFQITRVSEFFLHSSGWIRGGAKHYPSAAELTGVLEQAGLDVQVKPLHGRTPFNSYVIVGTPRAA